MVGAGVVGAGVVGAGVVGGGVVGAGVVGCGVVPPEVTAIDPFCVVEGIRIPPGSLKIADVKLIGDVPAARPLNVIFNNMPLPLTG